MLRLARAIHPGVPYHITHRGNRRDPVFFSDDDRREYLLDLRECADNAGLEIQGYCLEISILSSYLTTTKRVLTPYYSPVWAWGIMRDWVANSQRDKYPVPLS